MPASVINPNDGDDLTAASITVNVTDKIVAWEGSHEAGLTTNGAVRHTSDQIDDASLPEVATPSSGPLASGAGIHARFDMLAVVASAVMGSSGSGYAAKYASLGALTYNSLAAINTALTTGASAAAGSATLVRRASDGSANFTGTVGVVALSGTGNWATTGSVTSVDAVHSGVIKAGSGVHQITTAAGLLDATQLTNALPAGSFPAMTGDVTSSAGSLATVVSAVGGKTASQVASATTSVLAASSTGVGNHGAVAKYDVSGGMTFDGPVAAPSFVGTFSGNASSATTAGSAAALSVVNPVAMGGTGVATIPVGSVLIGAGTGPLASIAPGGASNVLISNGTVWTAGPVTLPDYSVATTKLADGAILPEGGTTRVWINALKKWSSSGVAVHWDGGYFDLATYIAALGTSQRAYVLLELNDTAAIHPNPGSPVTGPLADVNIPTKDPNTTALGLVTIAYGQTAIAASDIVSWRGPGESSVSGAGGGSPSQIGHSHAIAPEIRITSGAIDEGYPAPTVTPSLSILIYPLHYRSSAGIASQISVATTKGGFAVPGSGLRIYGVYFDPTIPGFANTAPSDDPSAPAKPAFSGNQRSICYVHLRSNSTVIKASDDGTNGWIEDARTFLAGSSPNTLPIGVSDGGTGQTNYTVPGLLMASGTTAFTTVAATTSANPGLAIAPGTTPGVSDSVQIALGGGVVAMGTSSLTNSVAVDILPGSRTGSSGNAANAYALRATGPTYGTGVNAAAYFKSGAAAGQAAIFDTVASPTGDIVQYKANGTAIGSRAADGRVGFGAAAQTAMGMYNGVTVTGSTTPYGFVMRPTLKPNASAAGAIGFDLGGAVDTTNGVVPAAYGMNLSALTKTGANAVTTVYGAFLQNQTIGTTNYGLVSNSANPSGFGLLNPTNTLDVAGTFGMQGPNVVAGSNYATGSGTGVAATFANADALAHLVSTATGGTGWSLGKYRFASRDNSGIGGYNVVVETHADSSSLGAWPSEKSGVLISSRTSDASYYPSGTPAQAAYTATFSGGQLTGITQTNAGAQYQVVPLGIVYGIGGSGSGATVTFTAAGGAITGATFTPGSGYTSGTVVFNPANVGLGGISISPPTITRDMVALDARVFIGTGNTAGRAWALGPQTIIESGADGLGYVMEGYIVNNGTDQALLNTNTSKYGLHIGAAGANPSTAAIYLDGGGVGLGQWHKGVVMAPTMLASGANDSFLELVGKFIVKPDGSVGINQPTPTAALHVVQGVVGTPAAKIVGLVGATANLLQVDASAVSNGQVLRADFSGHLYFTQLTAPGFTAGAGAGTTPGITVTGTDQSGTVAITPGSGPAASNATLITINFRNTRSSTPGAVMWTPANAAALNLARNQDTAVIAPATTAAGFAVAGGTAALIAGIPYEWQYVVL